MRRDNRGYRYTKGRKRVRLLAACDNWSCRVFVILSLICCANIGQVFAQQQIELDSGWRCQGIEKLPPYLNGETISAASYNTAGWMPAVVPGTVLTTLLHNKLIPDPFYGMNDVRIPDIYMAGRDHYTYWFVRDFVEPFPVADDKVFLYFRGINYSADIFMNGRKLNSKPDKGMFLRQSYDITPYLSKDRRNRLAVIVYPPDVVGNPNGGQGGDGMIAHSLTNQYVAGWDWIQPVRDRNTGIWDKVYIRRTKALHVEHTHVVTSVPGKRSVEGRQAAASLRITAEVENTGDKELDATVQYELEGKKENIKVKLAPQTMEQVQFPVLTMENPRLWWPNGYGPQNLYKLKVSVQIGGKMVSDEEDVTFGVREIKYPWNPKTNSREVRVNGQKIFVKGGNWILSDAMLRYSKERYDAEIRYHRDMNLNFIRVWGGGITERPEFYDACDKYGLMVFQDFWVSGDCNGRWYDPLKKEDTNARRAYPDDHHLFIEAAEDQIRMLRNHPSLAIWCGGNEIRPPKDILERLRDSLLPTLDGTRFFFEYSNDDSMSLNAHDGPYTIQPDTFFWSHHSYAFNSEIGSVGVGDYASLERFLPSRNMVLPKYDAAAHKWIADSVWQYHKYYSYDSSVEKYGHPKDVKDFAMKAQLVNYNQYRALIEGFTSHMWDWYTGVFIWKTQNPWTAMVGQMYDVYLDPNACLYGLREGAKPIHVMFDPVHRKVIVANNTFKATGKLTVQVRCYDITGKMTMASETGIEVRADQVATVADIHRAIDSLSRNAGSLLSLSLVDMNAKVLDENIYWLPDSRGNFSGLGHMPKATPEVTAVNKGSGRIEVDLFNPGSGWAFFNRVSVIDDETRERILPVFCNNNYISVPPGERRSVTLEFTPDVDDVPAVMIEGWNVDTKIIKPK